MKNMKNVLVVILCCVLLVSALTACGSSKAPETPAQEEVALPAWASNLSETGAARVAEIVKAGKLVFGTSADYAPFEFHTMVDGVDTIVGYDVAFGKYFAKELGVAFEAVDMSFDNLLISLNKGDFDLSSASFSITEERAKAVDFSDPYHRSIQVIVVRAEDKDNYKTTDDLKGIEAAAQKGSIQEGLAMQYTGETTVLLNKVTDEIAELTNGKVDAVYLDGDVGKGYGAAREDLEWLDVGIEYNSDGVAIALKKGDAGMVEVVNYLLSTIDQATKDQWLADAYSLAGAEVLEG